MSGDIDESHPARKIDHDELVEVLAKRNRDVPALTSREIVTEFPYVEAQTVRNNLDELADDGRIRMFYDGHTKVYWVPRDDEDGGILDRAG